MTEVESVDHWPAGAAMGTLVAVAQRELAVRWARLLRLHFEFKRLGASTRVRWPRNGRWRLRVRRDNWSETVMCAGADGVYAYITAHGRLLGTAGEVRYVARLLLWMVKRRQQ
ncbi:hypothetical protein [Actinomadura violacea]|uniref:Uncharacterized protein n=1 Tax=Actinomadura violacea TaxID=2819934 RepID=A0ABS3S4G9_9ACTN|nr:hypothetical protein [Actinomadura violacea]MBO2463882.1 hypothetical protein [Actinomadura violacea]